MAIPACSPLSHILHVLFELFYSHDGIIANKSCCCLNLNSLFSRWHHGVVVVVVDVVVVVVVVVVQVKGSMNNDFLVGNCPLMFGKHVWRVVINTAPYWVAVGVTRKPAYDRSASWGWSSVAHQLPEGQELDLMCDRWQDKDVLCMELDCDQRSLRMTNTRSGRHQTISNLPDGELYPWFVLYKQGDSIRIEPDVESTDER